MHPYIANEDMNSNLLRHRHLPFYRYRTHQAMGKYPEAMKEALANHDSILKDEIASNHGHRKNHG
jgi:hypothetical protein